MATVDGRVIFDAAGQQRTLRFTVNRLVELEEVTKLSSIELAAAFDAGLSMKALRQVMAAGLGNVGVIQAGELIEAIGIPEAQRLVTEAFTAAFAERKAVAGSDADPLPAAAG